MDRHMVYAVLVSSVVGGIAALWLVALVDDAHEKDLPHPRTLVHPHAHTDSHPAHFQHGHGLLAIYSETERLFLCFYDWHNHCSGFVVGLSIHS